MRTESKDVDIIVLMDEELTLDDLPDFEFNDYYLEVIHENYGGGTDNTVDFVIKMYSENGDRPIDLLVVSGRCFSNIKDYMEWNFPVTVQMIAWNIETGSEVNCTGSCLGKSPGYLTINARYPPYGAYTSKYMKYYPDATFVHKGKHIPHFVWSPAFAVANSEATKDVAF